MFSVLSCGAHTLLLYLVTLGTPPLPPWNRLTLGTAFQFCTSITGQVDKYIGIYTDALADFRNVINKCHCQASIAINVDYTLSETTMLFIKYINISLYIFIYILRIVSNKFCKSAFIALYIYIMSGTMALQIK